MKRVNDQMHLQVMNRVGKQVKGTLFVTVSRVKVAGRPYSQMHNQAYSQAWKHMWSQVYDLVWCHVRCLAMEELEQR